MNGAFFTSVDTSLVNPHATYTVPVTQWEASILHPPLTNMIYQLLINQHRKSITSNQQNTLSGYIFHITPPVRIQPNLGFKQRTCEVQSSKIGIWTHQRPLKNLWKKSFQVAFQTSKPWGFLHEGCIPLRQDAGSQGAGKPQNHGWGWSQNYTMVSEGCLINPEQSKHHGWFFRRP